ncbi:MAG: SpoIIE family protein phosphatase [Thermoflexibacter sp.]|nr:SpoIIE family protein phosphatase [Thermoflexibacter sp.]
MFTISYSCFWRILKYHLFIPLIFLLRRGLYCTVLLLHLGGYAHFAQAQALEPHKALTQYLIHKWTTENGLPSNTLNKITQTKDGYLWIAGYNGLVRFDGTYFTVYNRKNTSAFLTNSISDLYESTDGKLWIGTAGGGLVIHEKDSFRILQTKTTFNYPIEKIFRDHTNRLWVGTRSEGVFSFEGGDFKTYSTIDPLRDVSVKTITQDSHHTIWFGTEGKGIVRMNDDVFDNFTTKEGLADDVINYLIVDRKNTLWVGTNRGLSWFDGTKFFSIPELNEITINKILIDKYDCLWLGTTKGLYRLKPTESNTWEIESLSEQDGLPYKEITDLIFDKEGNLWVATYRGGLCRLQDGKFTNYTARDGLDSHPVSSVCEYKEGQFLVGTDVGIVHLITGSKIADFPIKTPLASERIRHLYKDKSNNIWISTYVGLLKINAQGQETFYTEENLLPDNQVRLVYEDSKSNIWIGMKSGGLLKIPLSGEKKVYNKLNILRSNFIMSISEDHKGNIVIGTNESGVMIISPDEKMRLVSTKNGLVSNTVFNIYIDSDNRYWVMTGGGLSLIIGEKVYSFTTKEGFPEDSPIDMLEDDEGTFWLPTYKGILKIKKQNLLDFINKKTKTFDYEYYGKYDGMNNEECTGTAKSLKSTDGRLWFPTLGGLAMLDPLKVKMNPLPPPVDIFKVMIDNNEEISPRFPITLMPNQQRITFQYTALSFTAPEKIRFRYRLRNYDKDWIEAGNERQAVYTSLPAGNFVFEVIAANEDGIWNKTGDSIPLTVKPQFYQTNSFYFVAGLFIILATASLYVWRINVIKARSQELEDLVTQRTMELNAQKEEMEAQNKHIEEQRQKLQESYEDIKIVSEIGQKVTALLNLNELVSTLYVSINEMMQAEGFGIGVYNPRMQRIEFKNYIENNRSSEHFFEMSEKNFLSVQCLDRREPIVINDLFKQYQSYITEPKIRGEKFPQSVIYLPLLFENKPLGVITVQSFDRDAYNDHHLTLLQTLASYISIALENTNAYKIIQEKNENITDSIRYGLTIQQAALPSNEKINEALHEYFTFFKPRDIVSGDFYWFNQVEDRIYLAVVDCTGHGVPGAFMSMLGITFLNEIVNVQKIYSPAKILELLHINIRMALNQEEAKNTDGMDIALCLFEPATHFIEQQKEYETMMTFAGAKLPVYYVHHGEFNEVRGTLKSVGGRQKEEYREFAEFKIKLSMGDSVYIYTDGLIDQNDPQGNRFGSQKVKDLIQLFHSLPMAQQKEKFMEEFENYRHSVIQRDDVTLIGLRL